MASVATSPTQTAIQVVQSLYEAFARGDIPFILLHVSSDCRWFMPGPSSVAFSGEYLGPNGVAQFFRNLAQAEQITRFEPRQFFSDGEDVFVLGYEECRSIATGKAYRSDWAMLFRIRDGEVAEWQQFLDTATYAAAHQTD